ncbi:hypothetical protein [Anabaena sp. PCC 7108]|uniref:hypothetical protein n=1 Tax=Anabaena sp. PCC 7108 TaxID=163908 RepID=UPI00036D4EBF
MRDSVIYQEILEEGFAEGEAKGITKGKVEGIAEATKKLALNLLRIGMSLEQISEVTELSLEQVQALQKEIENPNSN